MTIVAIILYFLGGVSFWWHLFDVGQTKEDPIFAMAATLFWPFATIVLGAMWLAEKGGYDYDAE